MTYDHRGEIAGRRATELEPLTTDKTMSKILTAAQVAEIKRDCNRGVYLGHGSTIEFCDSHEALRSVLKECVEGLEYTQGLVSPNLRLTAKKAITAAKEALGNG